ncbi:MAG: NRDE family protein, partial [Isosphaeraceae bacterium]
MIGANREESFRRPTTSPVCCRSGSIRCLVAGADHGPDGTFAEMGTWLGVNESGLVVAVTNRR